MRTPMITSPMWIMDVRTRNKIVGTWWVLPPPLLPRARYGGTYGPTGHTHPCTLGSAPDPG